ncbi:hypothetical protein D3C79_1054670 [compost metagenome]
MLQKALGGGVKLPVKEVEALSTAWQPWRAYAASWLWHAMSEQPALLAQAVTSQENEETTS